MQDFKAQLSKYKPKHSVLEIGITKSQDQSRIDLFKETIEIQKGSIEEKKARLAYHHEMQQSMEKARLEEDRKMIMLENKQLQLARQLEASSEHESRANGHKKLSKRA